nr:signal peptidase I [bacterium]
MMSRLRLRRFAVSGASMSPALGDGARFIGRLAHRAESIRRGSIVAFPHPVRGGFWMVKRVVGMGGETVTIEGGEVLIDGKAGLDHWGTGLSVPEGRWAVPPERVFVLSDQRPLTRDDSRTFGPVGTDCMYRMMLRYPSRSAPAVRPSGGHPA